jgi:quercetin dioxygenase-like cupin family protein
MTATPVVRAEGEGERLWFYGGGIFTVKATAAETGGSLFIFEDTMTQGKVTPLHLHPEEEEVVYVLEGELLLHIDGVEHAVGAGGLCVAPRGVPHAFLVRSAESRALFVLSPGRAEAFYRGASEPATDTTDPAAVDFDKLRLSAERNVGIEILGPPPFDMSKAGAAVGSGDGA